MSRVTPGPAAGKPGSRTRPAIRSDGAGVPVSALRAAATAVRLTWEAAPVKTVAFAICTLAVAGAPIVAAWQTKLILDRLVSGAAMSSLLAVAAGVALAGVVSAVLPQIVQYLRTEINRAVALAAENTLYRVVERFVGLAHQEDPRFLDRLRLAQQGATAPSSVIDGAFGTGRGALTASGFIGSLSIISPLMTLVVVLTAVPMLFMELQLSRRRAAMFWRIGPRERRQIFYQTLLESPQAAKEIRLFGIGRFLRTRMLAERRAADGAKQRVDRREVAVQGGLALLGAIIAGIGLVWTVAEAHRGALTVGDLSMFVASVAGVQGALNTLLQSFAQSHQQLLLFGHFVAVLRTQPDLPIASDPLPLPELRCGIEVRDVWFRYSDEHPWVLRGLNLYIPHGAAVAVVGLNGAGKSTLVKLLCRFYDPTYGSILWDGVDLRDADVTELRRRIGAVFQDYMEYDLSVAENIALGDLDALGDRVRLRDAACRSGAHGAIENLPQGYDTLLSRTFLGESETGEGQLGVCLSGGQWQRLALARAFLRDVRDLMILDEPSAGLDAEAEFEVHRSLKEHRSGRTSLLISHRLGSIRDADLIVVLSDGKVVEQGSHDELVTAEGAYAELFALQAFGYREEDESPFLGGTAGT